MALRTEPAMPASKSFPARVLAKLCTEYTPTSAIRVMALSAARSLYKRDAFVITQMGETGPAPLRE